MCARGHFDLRLRRHRRIPPASRATGRPTTSSGFKRVDRHRDGPDRHRPVRPGSTGPGPNRWTTGLTGTTASTGGTIDVERPAGTSIANGGTDSLGAALGPAATHRSSTPSPVPEPFDLVLGTAPVSTSNAVNCTRRHHAIPATTTVTAGSGTTFALTVNVISSVPERQRVSCREQRPGSPDVHLQRRGFGSERRTEHRRVRARPKLEQRANGASQPRGAGSYAVLTRSSYATTAAAR